MCESVPDLAPSRPEDRSGVLSKTHLTQDALRASLVILSSLVHIPTLRGIEDGEDV